MPVPWILWEHEIWSFLVEAVFFLFSGPRFLRLGFKTFWDVSNGKSCTDLHWRSPSSAEDATLAPTKKLGLWKNKLRESWPVKATKTSNLCLKS